MVRTRHQRRNGAETSSFSFEKEAPTENVLVKKEETSTPPPLSNSPKPITPPSGTFTFQNVVFDTYEEMVHAKRERNRARMISSGLLEASDALKSTHHQGGQRTATAGASQRGLRKRKESPALMPRRKSSRIAGVKAEGIFIKEEQRGGKFILGGGDASFLAAAQNAIIESVKSKNEFYDKRVNDGSDLSIRDAVEESGSKWVKDDSVTNAESFINEMKLQTIDDESRRPLPKKNSLSSQLESLSLDDPELVAKVVPERIYSVAFHPTIHKTIAVAGDKLGHIGFWDIDANSSEVDRHGVHLFKPHTRPISNLEFCKNGDKLLSGSYDGTVRLFDIQKETFSEVFASYDDSDEHKGKLGYGIDGGSRFWSQYCCLDHRNENGIFVCTSFGDVIHVDLRRKGNITFNENLSEKKINTLSLHKDGHIMATCGLDCTVKLWDVRKLKSKSPTKSSSNAVATFHSPKSINSAFFSPSGKYLLATTMSDKLEIISDAHKTSGRIIQSPTHSICHDNRTGRWLTTFNAKWHPGNREDLFVVGSMQQPRTIEVFNADKGKIVKAIRGEALTSVMSRCCFHPREDKLIVLGGNSSGRLAVAR